MARIYNLNLVKLHKDCLIIIAIFYSALKILSIFIVIAYPPAHLGISILQMQKHHMEEIYIYIFINLQRKWLKNNSVVKLYC